MHETVLILMPVFPEAAVVLEDEDKLREIGQLVSALVLRTPIIGGGSLTGNDFADALLQVRADAAMSGLTDAEIDADLAEWKRERASRRR